MFCYLGCLPIASLLHQPDHGEQLQAIDLIAGQARLKMFLLLLGLKVAQARVLAVADEAHRPGLPTGAGAVHANHPRK
jgi:hypothetical protein